jgi:indolepyruvate ferredoxin oxidoreductase alpha subunit
MKGRAVSKFSDRLTQREPWQGLMMGNHALVRAMLKAGVRVAATYPGSPTPEIADAISTIPEDQRTLHFEYCTNEKVATEVAFGASINGHLSTVFFKSVGLNVALDSVIQLSMMELIGGMVIVLGDDPGANSSQNEQDNRHIARMAYIPMLEPGTPSEAYEMFKAAAELSQQRKMPVFLRVTTHVCHAREVVSFDAIPERDEDWASSYDAANGPYWPITEAVFPLKDRALAKLDALAQEANTYPLNKVLSPNGSGQAAGKRLGIICCGLPAYSVLECLAESGANLDVLKLGMTYPLPENTLMDFLKSHDEVFLLEELDRVLEAEIKSLAFDHQIATPIHVRPANEYLMREFTPGRTWALLSSIWPQVFPARSDSPAPESTPVPRLPQMCPGCGHRSAFYAIGQLIDQEYSTAITVGDIGCHSLGGLPPYEIGNILLCMGHSSGTSAGMAINNRERPVIAFLGDSTFYHAGLPAIVNAIMHNHNFVLVLMENYTTAMTGHQPTAGSGEFGAKINIPKVLEALGCRFVKSVDAYRQAELQDLMREAIAFEGFAVVIAKHPCMLKFVREKQRKLGAKRQDAIPADDSSVRSGV